MSPLDHNLQLDDDIVPVTQETDTVKLSIDVVVLHEQTEGVKPALCCICNDPQTRPGPCAHVSCLMSPSRRLRDMLKEYPELSTGWALYKQDHHFARFISNLAARDNIGEESNQVSGFQ